MFIDISTRQAKYCMSTKIEDTINRFEEAKKKSLSAIIIHNEMQHFYT